MYKLNQCSVLIFILLISRAHGALKYNSLHEKLVLQLLKVKPNTNVVASPLLVRFPLCKLASVATGSARQELMTILGYKEDAVLNTCYSRLKEYMKEMTQTDLTQVNRIYVNYTDDIDKTFYTNSTEKFGVQVETVGFNYPKAALSFINRGVATGTYKRIIDILDTNDINKETMMVIVNAAHFKGTWEFPFDFRLTKLMKFHYMDTRITRVPMMTKVESFSYIGSGGIKLLSIKFRCWRSTITFVVPDDRNGLPKLLEQMQKDPNLVPNLVKKMKLTNMRIFLPRFKIKTYVDWSGFLQELGLYTVFNKNSSGLSILKEGSRVKNVPLNKIKQKLFIQIDELGVARFTRDPNAVMGQPPMPLFMELPIFSADRPFYFQITVDFENARYEMFSGVYYGPDPNSAINI